MKKILKKWGDSLVIVFDKEDREIYKLNPGDVIDIGMIRLMKQEKDNATK